MDVLTVMALVSIVAPLLVMHEKSYGRALAYGFVGVLASFAWTVSEMAAQNIVFGYTALGFSIFNFITFMLILFAPLVGRD